MAQKQTIAIIGATESVGSSIAKSLPRGNYRLILMGKDEEALEALRANLIGSGATAEIEVNSCAKEACWEADVIIIATSNELDREVIDRIKEVAVGKVVVSISSPVTRTYKAYAGSSETSAAEELQKLLPYSKVVKTFNSVFARDFKTSSIVNETGEIFIAGNNSDALEVVSKLILSAGFIPIIVGDLSVSRRLETLRLHG
jgi:predicted dinucleotide-binding enzyme